VSQKIQEGVVLLGSATERLWFWNL